MINKKVLITGVATITAILINFSTYPIFAEEINKKNSQGTAGFMKGELTLDFASSFDFGVHPISVKDEIYAAAPQKLDDGREVPNYIQISDLRGSAAGWTLSVQQKNQFVSIIKNNELIGAQIKFNNGKVISESINKPKDIVESVNLTPKVTEKLIFSDLNEGTGTWVYLLGDDVTKGSSVELSVPGKTFKESDAYKTVLTWLLSDVP